MLYPSKSQNYPPTSSQISSDATIPRLFQGPWISQCLAPAVAKGRKTAVVTIGSGWKMGNIWR